VIVNLTPGWYTISEDKVDGYTPTFLPSDRVQITASATVSITISNAYLRPNNPPVADDEYLETEENTPVTISQTEMLTGDTDPDSDALNFVGIKPGSGPADGTLSGPVDGVFTYTPGAGFAGTDQFTYMINDGHGGTAEAIVHITVTEMHGELTVRKIVADTVDSQAFTIKVTSAVGTPPQEWSAAIADGGEYKFNLPIGRYTVSEAAVSDYVASFSPSATVDLTATGAVVTVTNRYSHANNPPVAVDDSFTIPKNTSRSLDVLLNDYDSDQGDTITLSSVAQPGTVGAPQHGTAVIDNGTILYTPTAGYVGTDSFTYTIVDSHGLGYCDSSNHDH
jgi:hypothetical protein